MRKLLSLIGISLLIIGGILSTSQQTVAQYNPHNPGGGSGANIPYCQGKSCSIDKSVEAAKGVTGGFVESGQGDKPLSEYIIDIVLTILQYTTLVAVIYVLYSGFRIMTSNGDENTIKTARTSIIYVLVGIIVMWLAYAIVHLVIGALGNARTASLPNQKSYFTFSIVPQAHAQNDAIYSESEKGTFNEYKSKLNSKLQDLVSEIKIHKEVNLSSLNEIKLLLEEAYKRLPDKSPTDMEENKGKKKLALIAVDIAKQDPKSSTKVTNVVNTVGDFLGGAKILQISGNIEASPDQGNAPLTVSFRTNNVVDPAGTTPSKNNYVWWKRNSSGQREDLGRGPSFMHIFEDEGSHTVFLDIKSSSKNQFGYTDVLPVTLSQKIEVKPKLGEIVLLINGVDVKNKSSIKITPDVASRGLIFDATASRAVGNGTITKTRWEFGNGNTEEYNGNPGIERQAYSNEGEYPVSLEFISNSGKKFKKEVRIDVRNPAAVIKTNQKRALVGEKIEFSIDSFFNKNTQNIEYNWNIQGSGLKNKISRMGESFSHTFKSPGEYIVTLAAKSPNGSIDSDSQIITVESRDPVVTINTPTPVDDGHPNTLIFDGSKSFDPDMNSRDGLLYTWKINGQDRTLDNPTLDGARGTLTFNEVGSYSVSLTVTNKYGKVATNEQEFEVKSLLAVDMSINPEVAQIKKPIRFTAKSERADFFEWDFGDGSAQVNGDKHQIEHTYKETGIYTVRLRVRTTKNDVENTITRRVYITDTNQPFALIQASNASNSIIEESGLCQDTDAFTVNRSEPTTFDGGKSVNVDGKPGNLSYTWRYMGKVNTSRTITETFGDLGCFPISLTVRSDSNGASSTMEKYIYLKNQLPRLSNITTQVDERKKDSRKMIVHIKANGATDPDGVITSYTWYYKTETDRTAQGLQITQKPEITFVLPNIAEKYYFGVVLRDNDNGEVNSENILPKQAPVIGDDVNGNVYLPLISLNPSKRIIKVNESVRFTASATTILNDNITNKSKYAWDFDGDGHIDKTTQEPYIDHTYKRAGTYNMKVRVTYNGVSNVKYQTITVRNPLKASLQAYRLENSLYLINTSEGTYDKALWKFGEYTTNSLHSALIPYSKIPLANSDGVIGELSVSYNDNEIDTAKIRIIDAVSPVNEKEDVTFQSSIPVKNNTITIDSSLQGFGFSLYGNDPSITRFAIDTDTSIDSSLNGNPADDIDNKNHPSYKDGSFFRIPNFAKSKKRNHTIKITLFAGEQVKAYKDINLILDFIPEVTDTPTEMGKFGSGTLSDFEKQKINKLQEMIRSIPDDADRIIIMKKYNILVENWGNSFEKAQALIDIQELIVDTNISNQQKSQITDLIDQILIGDGNKIDNIAVAAKLVRDLIPEKNANRTKIISNLDTILGNIDNYNENKKLAKEILTLIENDTTIPTKYKEYIKSQLLIIIDKGEKKDSQITPVKKSGEKNRNSESSGIMGIIMGIARVFLFILGLILVVILGAYVFYRLTRKNSKLAFQDFMIDSIFHAGKKNQETKKQTSKTTITATGTSITTGTTITPSTQTKETTKVDPLAPKNDPLATPTQSASQPNDPLTSFQAPTKSPSAQSPDQPQNQQTESMPDWLKSPKQSTTSTTQTNISEQSSIKETPTEHTHSSQSQNEEGMPDWLKPSSIDQVSQKTTEQTIDPAPQDNPLSTPQQSAQQKSTTDKGQETKQDDEGIPDWLKPASENQSQTDTAQENTANTEEVQKTTTEETITSSEIQTETAQTESTPQESLDDIPDWLKGDDSSKSQELSNDSSITEKQEIKTTKSTEKGTNSNTDTSISTIKEDTIEDDSIPDWLVDNSSEEQDDNTIPDWLVEAAEEEKSISNKEQEETKEKKEKGKNPPLEIEDISSEKEGISSIQIEDTGVLEDTAETNLVDTAVANDSVKIIEDESIIAPSQTKDKKEVVQDVKKKKTQTPRTKQKRGSTRKKSPTQKTVSSTKKVTTKKSTKPPKESTQTNIPDWLK